MAIKKIITEPDPLLRKKSISVDKVDRSLQKLMDDMIATMYHAPGIGLAAVQIGLLKRIIVIDISKDENEKKPLFLVNPKKVWTSKETSIYEEGCLSIPGYFADVERPSVCEVEYLDYFGKPQKIKTDGLLSTCLQHEIDHLDGILFIDYLSKLKKDLIIKKLSKQKNLSKNLVL